MGYSVHFRWVRPNRGDQNLKRICVLVKQVPKLDGQTLGSDGRLVRTGLESEMNPYCRRAVAKGVELAKANSATCTRPTGS